MSIRSLFGKQTWVGFGIAVGIMVLSLLMGAWIIVKGIAPYSVITPWLTVSYALSGFIGGCWAGKERGRHTSALIPSLILYCLVWMLAFSCGDGIDFTQNGLAFSFALLFGGVAAFTCTVGRRGRRHSAARKKAVRHSYHR